MHIGMNILWVVKDNEGNIELISDNPDQAERFAKRERPWGVNVEEHQLNVEGKLPGDPAFWSIKIEPTPARQRLFWVDFKEDCGRDDWSLLVWATSKEEALATWKKHWQAWGGDEEEEWDSSYGEPTVVQINTAPPKTAQIVDWQTLGLSDVPGGPKP